MGAEPAIAPCTYRTQKLLQGRFWSGSRPHGIEFKQRALLMVSLLQLYLDQVRILQSHPGS